MVVHFSHRSDLNGTIFSPVVIRKHEEYSEKGNDAAGFVLRCFKSL